MARIRTLAGGIASWIALAGSASAAPLSWFDSQATLTSWYANQLNSAGNIYAPPASSNTFSNLPANWYSRAAAPSAPAPAPTATTYSTTSTSAPVTNAGVATSQLTPTAVAVSASTSTTANALSFTPQPTFGTGNQADAFINMGASPYAGASTLTVGTPQPWYQSPAAVTAFGGAPNASQQDQFEQDVLSKVEKTFQLSGLNVNVTDDPNVPASHMMSVVSGASYGPNPNAIGITNVGRDGFSFIDKLSYATNEDQLSWAVAHNVSHELMHAFGVSNHPDTTGGYVDAATADWKLLTDPNATFSPAATALLKSASANGIDSGTIGAEVLRSGTLAAQCSCPTCYAAQGLQPDGDQVLAAPVPEPATIAVWMAAGLGGAALLRRNAGRAA